MMGFKQQFLLALCTKPCTASIPTIRFITIQNRNALWVGRYRAFATAVYVVMHDVRTHRLYLCVGSTASSLDIFLFVINLMALCSTWISL